MKKKSSKQNEKKTVTTTTTTVVEEVVESKKPGKTYYAFVVDRSGSMYNIAKETINNFNEQIGTLRALQEKYPEENYYVTLCLFDHEINTVYKDKPLNEVEFLNDKTYVPRGSTSLHDAIGATISDLKDRQAKKLKKSTNEALVVVLTDGQENSSQEWKGKRVVDLIKDVDSNDNWTISFIGASKESALDAASTLGIQNTTYVDTSSAAAYASTTVGINNALFSRGYAKSKGASLKSAMFSATVDNDGQLNESLDMAQLDSMIEEQKKEKSEEKSEKK